MAVSNNELVDAAVTTGLIAAADLAQLRVEARRSRTPLIEAVASHGRFPLSALFRAVADSRKLPFVDLQTQTLDVELVKRVPEALLRKRKVLPIHRDGEQILLATADPDDRETNSAVERILGEPVALVLADPESIAEALDRLLGGKPGSKPASDNLAALSDSVALLDRIFKEAFLRRASDIHLESVEGGLRVRFRTDGRLHVYLAGLNASEGNSLLSRVKVLAGLNIAEQRAPQDGRFTYRTPATEQEIDVRVATIPERWGERATLRLLGLEGRDFTLTNLGMSAELLERFSQAIRRPWGMILLTGPTGSGKSTTLYAALREINQPHLNIMTVEDPIEYVISGVSQVHVGGGAKVTFAGALRSLLRHDPDILMVGEIRDYETADVALKAAMTGHMVFSTLHTNTACAAITRLVDIGCEPYLVGSTLVGVIAQRLVRRLCDRCKRPRPATPEELNCLDRETAEVCEPVGCVNCLGSGFRGRIGLFEPLWIDNDLGRLISAGASQKEIEAATQSTRTTLRADGIAKVLAGVTTLDEVITACVAE